MKYVTPAVELMVAMANDVITASTSFNPDKPGLGEEERE